MPTITFVTVDDKKTTVEAKSGLTIMEAAKE